MAVGNFRRQEKKEKTHLSVKVRAVKSLSAKSHFPFQCSHEVLRNMHKIGVDFRHCTTTIPLGGAWRGTKEGLDASFTQVYSFDLEVVLHPVAVAAVRITGVGGPPACCGNCCCCGPGPRVDRLHSEVTFRSTICACAMFGERTANVPWTVALLLA